MQDTELFELCKEVYKRHPNLQVEESMFFANDYGDISLLWGAEILPPAFAVCPLYTSDYLLEKLPHLRDIDFRVEQDGFDDDGACWVAYGKDYDPKHEDDHMWRSSSHTPLKALLKLVIALDDAGELK